VRTPRLLEGKAIVLYNKFVENVSVSWEVQAGVCGKRTLFGKRKVREHVIPLVSIGEWRARRTNQASERVGNTEGHAEMTTSV